MAFDIYGFILIPGYCEVHPDVHQEYPCDLCYAQDKIRDSRNKDIEDRRKEMEDVFSIHLVQDRVGIPESFSATMNLRYGQRPTINENNGTGNFTRWLQQMWQGSNGTQEWRWVEEIEEQ